MADLLPERKISHRIWEELGAKPEEIKKGLAKGLGFAAPPGISAARTAVILRKADLFTVMALLEKLPKEYVTGHTDFFVFARLTADELKQVETFKEVDRIFLDEPLTAYLDQAVETTKAKASWNTFEHYGEGLPGPWWTAALMTSTRTSAWINPRPSAASFPPGGTRP